MAPRVDVPGDKIKTYIFFSLGRAVDQSVYFSKFELFKWLFEEVKSGLPALKWQMVTKRAPASLPEPR